MQIRKAEIADLSRIMEIYAGARKFMAENGNPTQWADNYPQEEIIYRDIEAEHFFVCTEAERVVGAFAFCIGEDLTYQKIEQGNWHSDQIYGTIHRLVSDGSVRGVAKQCFEFCYSQIPYLRIDTHKDNIFMQKAVLKWGFQKCGIIYVANGSERIAFDYKK